MPTTMWRLRPTCKGTMACAIMPFFVSQRSRLTACLLKQLHGVAEGLQHPPQQRNADKSPGQKQLQLHRTVVILSLHDFSPYAPAGLPTAPTLMAARSASSSFMGKRA